MGKTRSSSEASTKKAAVPKAKPKISHQKKAKPAKVQAKAPPKVKPQKAKAKKSKPSPKQRVVKEPKAAKPAK